MKKSPERNKKDTAIQKNKISAAKIAGLAVLVVLLITAIAYVIIDAGLGRTKNDDSLQVGNVFYHVLPESVVDMQPFSDGLVVLTDTAVEYVDTFGTEISVNSHTYANPAMYACKKNVMVFDRGGYSFRIEKNGSLYNEFTVSSVITAGAIDKKGNYAYCLNSDGGYQSHLYVYSYNGKKQFEWGSASDYIIGISLSDNGRYCAVTLAGVENAEYYSRIVLFNFNDSEPLYSVVLDGVSSFDTDFISGKKLAVFTDSGVLSFDSDGKYSEIKKYSSSELSHCTSYSSGLKVLSLSKYANEKLPCISVYDKKFELLFENNYSETINTVKCSPSYVTMVFDDKIETINSQNTTVGTISLSEACLNVCISGRHLYVLTAGGLYSYYVNSVIQSADGESEATSVLQN